MPLTRFKLSAIADGGIVTAKLADSAVTTVKVADSAVNSAKIGVDVIAAEDLANNSVTVAELANSAVTTAKINDGAVTSAKLDTNIDIAGTLDVTGETTLDDGLTVEGGVVFNEAGADADFRVESDTNANMFLVDAGNNYVTFGTNATDMGSSSSGEGVTYRNGEALRCQTDSNTTIILNRVGTDGAVATLRKNGASVGDIDVDSNGATYNTTSDRRLKDNIKTITDGTDKLMSMNPVTHTWINNPEAPAVMGFIAQEMQEIVPEAVSGDANSDEMMSMDYGRITPVLVAALQDAHRKIEELESRIKRMEAN